MLPVPHFDIVVVGGGHAGVEAAWAASQLGACTALVTMDRHAIARMSCNPAIGGLGKGHMVREIDALGGLMGLAIDRAGIQFRMLNRSKGPAVWAPRAQADRDLYPKAVQDLLSRGRSLEIIEGSVEQINTCSAGLSYNREIGEPRRLKPASRKGMKTRSTGSGNPKRRVRAVTLADGRVLNTDTVILTTGTFLRGLMHCGLDKTEGGRVGESSAVGLSASLKSLGFELGRLKTGTPPRVHRDTVDFDRCELQPGDDVAKPFSFMNDGIAQRQIDCWITWTNDRVHEHIRGNLHRAPMYSGQIESTGPRYCPSIEDKVVRFADKPRHQIFLEPEGYDDERIYCNGISTSLPQEVQDAFVREVPGLENARIVQHGYAVEYDYVPTHQTKCTLETKLIDGLFLAGQINGTSGYEEAAALGMMAGINAVRRLRGDEAFVLGRDEAYIGVMIDDLITRPPSEPYRMFTSRAEYRLRLRADNADQRLTPMGRELGTVSDERWRRFEQKRDSIAEIQSLVSRGQTSKLASSVECMPLETWVRRPDIALETFADIVAGMTDQTFCSDTLWQVLVEAKYSGYIGRQERQIEKMRRLESLAIPDRIDYAALPELRTEARECLTRVAPRTLGQASRLSGISPSDLTILWVYITRRHGGRSRTVRPSA